MKKITKITALLLAACMSGFTLASCGDNGDATTGSDGTNGGGGNDTPAINYPMPTSQRLSADESYDNALGDFYELYEKAGDAKTVSERFALMAIAEAKLMESGVMVPMQSNGGNYAISKVAPYTISPVLWGTDSSRYHNALVATEPITPADRDALKALWAETKGTGTYEEKARDYLEEKGYEIKRTYTLNYSSDPDNLDLFTSSKTVNSDVLVNTYDGLVEYDGENVLQPALAEKWEKTENEDGTVTWTFTLREGVMWVNSNGEELAELTADDFVAGFQHMLDDATGQLSWLITDKIVGAAEYTAGEADMEDVGVKAVDDYTLEYTLMSDVPYFDTMLTYGEFAPLCRSFYESLGGKFGFGNGDAGSYGKTKDDLAYCGPYIITAKTDKQTIVFEKNESYWNKDNINLDKITWVYVDTSNATNAYRNFADGTVDGSGLNSAAVEMAKNDGNFDKYAYVSSTDATCFPGFLNLDRQGFVDSKYSGELQSAQTDAMKERINRAMNNQNFRLALCFGLDRASYLATRLGDDLKYTSMSNMYTPGNFVELAEDTTVTIGGAEKTYKAGTYYGQIVQDQIDADGFEMKVWDPDAEEGIGSSAGFDGWYNAETAKAYLDKAIEELKAEGVEVSADMPIHMDYPYEEDGSTSTAAAHVVKDSIEKFSGGAIIVDLMATEEQNAYLNSTYYYEDPAEANYDLSLNSGWGPDYGDPSTFLDTMVKGGGYMLKCLGLGV